uniref:Uncharacterized protein n=1 Tax=Romanomermis culicivorax TaxID=13658 RepID=A0A915K0X3_ROMCU
MLPNLKLTQICSVVKIVYIELLQIRLSSSIMLIKRVSKFLFPFTFLWLMGLTPTTTTTVPKWRRKRELSDFRFSQCSRIFRGDDNFFEW